MGLLNLSSIVMHATVMSLRETDFLTDDICQLPITSQAITELVARFADSDKYVCMAAMRGFIELAKHGNVYCFVDPLRGIDLLTDNIRQLPIISDAIKSILAIFAHPDEDVRRSAIDRFTELVKHGKVYCCSST